MSMLLWITIALLVIIIGGCAIAWGTNSRASVGINTDVSREVVEDTKTIEEAFSPANTIKASKDTSPP